MHSRFWRTGLALLLAAVTSCAPLLQTYLAHLDPEGPVFAAANPVARPAPAPVVARAAVVCRFLDERPEEERTRTKEATIQAVTGVISLGLTVVFDAFSPENRDQPMDGLEDEVGRRLASYLQSSGTFASCTFVDRSRELLLGSAGGGGADSSGALGPGQLLITGTIHRFAGRRDDTTTVSVNDAARSNAIVYGHGAIRTVIEVIDPVTRAVVWQGDVAVDESRQLDPKLTLGDTTCTLENKFAVMALGAFVKQAELDLRSGLASTALAAPIAPPPSSPPVVATSAPTVPSVTSAPAALAASIPVLGAVDLARSIAWYHDQLGFESRPLAGGGSDRVLLEQGGALLLLQHVAAAPAARSENGFEVWFRVNVRALASLWSSIEGHADLVEPLHELAGGGARFVVRDPDGNRLCFGD